MELSDNNVKLNWLQIGFGLTALALGVVLYLYDRPSSLIYFVPDFISQYEGKPFLFGVPGYHLPTLLHVFAFCLLSVGILGSSTREAFFICLFWLLTDSIFEIAQHPAVANKITGYIPDWFSSIPVLENTANYFIQGRYDPADLVAILFGTIIAYALILFQQKNKNGGAIK